MGNRPGPRTGGRGGIPISFTRQSTSKEILDVEWNYPVPNTFADRQNKGKKTAAAFVERALPRELAFKDICGDNRKPLLVLRECVQCKGTEHAVFSRKLNNEKTLLLCQWFHCVKLPPRVLNAKHPYRKVFAKDKPAHVFISMWDGSDLLAFDGNQPQSTLQKAMADLLAKTYEKKPKKAIQSMLRLLSRLDMLDAREIELRDRLEKEIERRGPTHTKVKKAQKQLAKIRADKKKTMKSAKAVCDLKLKVVKATPCCDKKSSGAKTSGCCDGKKSCDGEKAGAGN